MIITIDAFAKQYIALAKMRGLSARNPVTFIFRPDANDQTNVFQVVCSLTEPSFADKPYNLLWIDANPGSSLYQATLRRTSHVSDGIHRSSWVSITSYEDLFTSRQFYRNVVENASSLGIDPGDIQVSPANTARAGVVLLKMPPSEIGKAVVVSDSDPRMTDAREPTSHEHDDLPRTMVRLNSSAFVQIDSTNAPQPGYVLAIVDQDPTNSNKFYGQWVKPTASNVAWTSPRLIALRISLPGDASYISDNSEVQMVCTAEWEDTVKQNPTGTVWSIEENVIGVTISPTGLVKAPDLGYDVTLKVTARLQDPVYGNWLEATYQLLIRDMFHPDDELLSISIIGPDEMYADQRDTFTVIANYKSGSKVPVLPKTLTSDSNYLILTGQVGEAKSTSIGATAVVSAEYDFKGTTFRTKKNVKILAQKLTKLEIVGPAEILSEKTGAYDFKVTWTNGRTEYVTATRFWAEPEVFTTIVGNKVTVLKEETTDHRVTLKATYSSSGSSIEGNLTILLKHVPAPVYLTGLKIDGATIIQENSMASYMFLASYSDNSIRVVSPLTFSSNRPDVLTILGNEVSSGEVTQDVNAVLTATYLEGEIQKTATLGLTVLNVTGEVDLSSIRISGPNVVDQQTQTDYRVIATFTDGSQRDIPNPDVFQQTVPNKYSSVVGTKLIVGVVDVPLYPITLTSTHTINGIRRTANYQVSLIGQTPVPVDLRIEGPDSVDELGQGTYVARAYLTDNSNKLVPAAWSVIQGAQFATIDQNGVLKAGGVEKNEQVLIRAVAEGLTHEKSVTIKNVIEVGMTQCKITPISPPFAYNDKANMQRDLLSVLTFTDGTTRAPQQNEITYTLDAAGSEFFVIQQLPKWVIRTTKDLKGFFGTKTISVTARATVDGITKTDVFSFNLVGPTDEVESVTIDGPATLAEGQVEEYRILVKRLSGAITTYREPRPVWSTSNKFGIIQSGSEAWTTRVKASTELTKDETTNLTAAPVTVDGVNYTPALRITIKHNTTKPTSATAEGPIRLEAGQTGEYKLKLGFSDGSFVYGENVIVEPEANSENKDAFNFLGNNKIVANVVSEDKMVNLYIHCLYQGIMYHDFLYVTNFVGAPVLEWITIVGPEEVRPGTTTAYIGTGTMSDQSNVIITDTATWTVTDIDGSYPGVTISKGKLVVPDGTATGSVRITCAQDDVSRSLVVAIKPAAAEGYSPRWGAVKMIDQEVPGYDKAFVESLTRPLTNGPTQIVRLAAQETNDTNEFYYYFMWPIEFLGGKFTMDNTPGGGAGGFDGANQFDWQDDTTITGRRTLEFDGKKYVLYRSEVPLNNPADIMCTIEYGVKVNSSNGVTQYPNGEPAFD